jgi:hypothetical protein
VLNRYQDVGGDRRQEIPDLVDLQDQQLPAVARLVPTATVY